MRVIAWLVGLLVLIVLSMLILATATGQRLLMLAQGAPRAPEIPRDRVLEFVKAWRAHYPVESEPDEAQLVAWYQEYKRHGTSAEAWAKRTRYGDTIKPDGSAPDATEAEISSAASLGQLHPRTASARVRELVFDEKLAPGEAVSGITRGHITSRATPGASDTPEPEPGWMLVTDRAVRWHFFRDGIPPQAPPVIEVFRGAPREVAYSDITEATIRRVPPQPGAPGEQILIVLVGKPTNFIHVFYFEEGTSDQRLPTEIVERVNENLRA